MKQNLKVDRLILLFALRHAMGVKSYTPSMVINNIKSNLENINTEDLKLYIEEIEMYEKIGMEFDNKEFEMENDSQEWLDFKKFLKNELYKRKS